MKNIHVLPTYKPSRLAVQLDCKPTYNLQLSRVSDLWTKNWDKQNICITSDEEIREGDYVYSIAQDYNMQKVSKELEKLYNDVEHYKKIILTTDQDLIKDGVQEVDDEFLEWFVNNPSCEEVEVNKDKRLELEQNFHFYEIIIPKEEPKQETLEGVKQRAKGYMRLKNGYVEPKQETLEEAAEKIYNEFPLRSESLNELAKEKFITGAKWQQERSYSEEEVNEIISASWLACEDNEGETFTQARARILEQFKKK